MFGRLFNYYKLEWGQAVPPTDPNALSSRREGWPDAPMTTPPMPFTEWPYGGTTSIGVTRPNSVDSPLMNAIGNTSFGQWLNDAHIQIYGWINAGGNLSTNTTRPGGNAPVVSSRTLSATPPKPPTPNELIVAAVRRCAGETLHGGAGTITISSMLTVDVTSDGKARLATFHPPLMPELQSCIGKVVYETSWSEPGAHDIPIELHL